MRIFISYSRTDIDYIETAAIALEQQGHIVFFDRRDLKGGDVFNKKILREIKKCDYFLFFISKNSLQVGSYSLSELNIAFDRNKNVIPVLLDDTKIEDSPARLQVINWFESSGNLDADLCAFFDSKSISTSRRIFVLGCGAAGVVVTGLGLYVAKPYIIPKNVVNQLVTNSNNGIAHHRDICSNHIPFTSNQRKLQPGDVIHESLRVNIFEALARDEIKDEDKIKWLVEAIEFDPTALRIYDKLTRLYGKLKRYESIHLTLRNGHSRVIKLADQAASQKTKVRYVNIANLIEERQVAASNRAIFST